MEKEYRIKQYPNNTLKYHSQVSQSDKNKSLCYLTFNGGRDNYFNFLLPNQLGEWFGEELMKFINNYIDHIDTSSIKLSDLFNPTVSHYINQDFFDVDFISDDTIDARVRLFAILIYMDRKVKVNVEVVNNFIYYYDNLLNSVNSNTNFHILKRGLDVHYFRHTVNGFLINSRYSSHRFNSLPISIKYDYTAQYDIAGKIFALITDTAAKPSQLLSNYRIPKAHYDKLIVNNCPIVKIDGKEYNHYQLLNMITRLPLFLDEFREFVVANYTKEDLTKIVGKIGKNIRSSEVAIKMAQDIVGSSDSDILMQVETYYNFVKCYANSVNVNDLTALHNYLINNKSKALVHYLYELSNIFVNNNYSYSQKDFYNILDYFFKGKISVWITPKYRIGDVVELLLAKASVLDIYKLIISFPDDFNTAHRMTYDSWEIYCNNYEEYKDYPVSWWINLIE